MVRAFSESDVSDVIGQIKIPTLILHSLGRRVSGSDAYGRTWRTRPTSAAAA